MSRYLRCNALRYAVGVGVGVAGGGGGTGQGLGRRDSAIKARYRSFNLSTPDSSVLVGMP